MAKIAIVLTTAPSLPEAFSAVRRFDSTLSLAVLKKRFDAREPIVEVDLTKGFFSEASERLQVLLRELEAAGAEMRLFEMDPEDNFDWNSDVRIWERSLPVMMNILTDNE